MAAGVPAAVAVAFPSVPAVAMAVIHLILSLVRSLVTPKVLRAEASTVAV